VLGPLGQSITATGNLANVGGLTLHAPYAAGADAFALLYGIPTWGFAMAWLAIAASMTVRAARKGLPFGLTWWSFTFPVGTCVTGTIGLAARTGADLLRYGAAGLFLLPARHLADRRRPHGARWCPRAALPAGARTPAGRAPADRAAAGRAAAGRAAAGRAAAGVRRRASEPRQPGGY